MVLREAGDEDAPTIVWLMHTAFEEYRDSHLYFSRLSVLPDHRCQGIGRRLIDYVEARATPGHTEPTYILMEKAVEASTVVSPDD